MTSITGPTVTSAVSLGPISQALPPQYRFARDDWDDENAFTFTFYSVLPTFDQNGNILTQGTVRDLTNCSLSGTVEYAPRDVSIYPDAAYLSPAPFPMVGSVNIQTGQGTLTLAAAYTTFPRQDEGLWTAALSGDSSGALLTVRARLTDANGKTATKGVIPLFVF